MNSGSEEENFIEHSNQQQLLPLPSKDKNQSIIFSIHSSIIFTLSSKLCHGCCYWQYCWINSFLCCCIHFQSSSSNWFIVIFIVACFAVFSAMLFNTCNLPSIADPSHSRIVEWSYLCWTFLSYRIITLFIVICLITTSVFCRVVLLFSTHSLLFGVY